MRRLVTLNIINVLVLLSAVGDGGQAEFVNASSAFDNESFAQTSI
jgi:hypothetical protein